MFKKLLPHATIVLCGMYLVFFLIDRVNSAMAFINNNITKRLLLVLCAFAVIESVWMIREDRRRIRLQQSRADAARRQRSAPRPSEERPRRDYASRPSGYTSRRDYPAPRRALQTRSDYQPRRRLYDEDTSASYRR